MSSIQGETIAAISTAIVPQQGGIGIVRMSGDRAIAIARALFDAPGKQPWASHRLLYGYIRHPETKALIDEALLLLMYQPRSYTREDVVEFHCHGGIVPVQQVLQLCISQGARLAQPGEFTLRAFLNGRIDLTQAESISELVAAQSQAASQAALAGLQGKLAEPIRQLRATCVQILAEVEARIDFEDDLPPLDEETIKQQLQEVLTQIKAILATAERGELLRSGLKVAIVGRPNVGKSSLLNAWSQSDRAIVTDLPGTTRDVIESTLVVGGIPIQVLDTAGIRDTVDTVEQIGVERSRQAAESADLVLLTIDAAAGWTDEDNAIYDRVKHHPLILVINKVDLVCVTGGKPASADRAVILPEAHGITYPPEIKQIVTTIAQQKQGIAELETAILQAVKADKITATNLDLAINQRQSTALTKAKVALEQVQTTIGDRLPLDFWTIDLRGAIQALGEITGEEIAESVLERIFSQFCIGK